MFPYSDKFVPVNSYLRIGALATLTIVTFILAFAIFPFAQLQLHFFQAGIFLTSFIFGPIVGGAVGALTSSYNAMFVIHNPWIIGGNLLLGVAAAYLYTKTTPFKAALGAFAIQLPYVALTDVFLVGMPVQVVGMIAVTLLIENVICAAIASSLAPHLRAILDARA